MMKRLSLWAAFTFVILYSCTVQAQSQFSGWLASFNTIKTGKKTSIHSDFQLRSSGEFERIQTVLLRVGLNVHLNPKITVTAGYAFIDNYRAIGAVNGYNPEHRMWEQLLYNHKLKKLLIAHRFRLEQRFIGKAIVIDDELETDGYGYANRFRYLIRAILPFSKQATFSKGIYAALQNELFLNFGNTTAVNRKTFDQNRFYPALGYRLNKSLDLEAGYMNQYVNGRDKAYTNNNIVQVAGYLKL